MLTTVGSWQCSCVWGAVGDWGQYIFRPFLEKLLLSFLPLFVPRAPHSRFPRLKFSHCSLLLANIKLLDWFWSLYFGKKLNNCLRYCYLAHVGFLEPRYYFHSFLGASCQYLNIIIDDPCANFLRHPECSFLLICKGQFCTYLTGLRKFPFLLLHSFLSLYVLLLLLLFVNRRWRFHARVWEARLVGDWGYFPVNNWKVCSVSSWNVLSRETFWCSDHSWLCESLSSYFQPQFMHVTIETWSRFHGKQEILEVFWVSSIKVFLLSSASQLRPTWQQSQCHHSPYVYFIGLPPFILGKRKWGVTYYS